ncbi:ABC transporter substrate-binding protein [Halorubrum halophilum]|uniref:ABC transporter substrate-binding protein n=1 Tax=Halorubrum halophilum TaxID=413816 RepID=UPI0006795FAD|nr:ABC transporter substrate-binding protein [Halorubrum halophilum]
MRQQHCRSGSDKETYIGRRRWLSALGVAGAATLAGCSDRGGDGGDGSDGGDGRGGGAGNGRSDGTDTPEVGDFPQFGVDDLYGAETARDLARQAFERSEYDYAFDGGELVTPEGEQVTLDIYYRAERELSRLTAEFIARELGSNLGIDVVVEAIDGARFNNEYWTGDPEGGADTVNGEEIEWTNPTPQNPGPRSVTGDEPWDMSIVFGLNTHPLNPLMNELFFDGANPFYNPVGYYPQFDAQGLFQEARQATSRDDLRESFAEIFGNLAREQPYITLLFSDDLVGYNPDLEGPIENFSNGWDLPAWYEGEPTVSGSYDTVTSAGFRTLNPLYNTESHAGVAIGRALDRGYTFDESQEYFPLLYDMSTEDGEVWTFDVRENLRFSEPYGQVTAEDFVYLVEELHQSDWANTASSSDWDGVEVEQTGEFEFQATLESPNPLWPRTYDPLLYPIPRDLVEPYVEEEDASGLEQDEGLLELGFTGNLGAFELEAWNRGSGTEYVRNDEYYLRDIDEGPDLFSEGPLFEAASISVVEERESRLRALETGETDSAAIPPERYESYSDSDNVTVRRVPTPYNTILSVNQRSNGWNAGPGNLFRLVPFRQALAAAIGKRELIDGVYHGLAEPQFTWQPRWSEFSPADN